MKKNVKNARFVFALAQVVSYIPIDRINSVSVSGLERGKSTHGLYHFPASIHHQN